MDRLFLAPTTAAEFTMTVAAAAAATVMETGDVVVEITAGSCDYYQMLLRYRMMLLSTSISICMLTRCLAT